MEKILITGASGYIGSCLFQFLKKSKHIINGLDKIKNNNKKIFFCDLLKKKKLERIIKFLNPTVIIHLAAQSLVDETINKKKYFTNNLIATKILLNVMNKYRIKNLIFSSTAAVYKNKNKKIKETDIINPKSNYAKTKYLCEKLILENKNINSVILRFFNVCSALTYPKLIGELHKPETHLIPTVIYKAINNKKIYIYGNNFKTKDGFCVRDYIHIKDICFAIKSSIKFLKKNKKKHIFNLGNSEGFSNIMILNYVKKVLKKNILYKVVKRRKGDSDSLICNSNKARKLLKCSFSNSKIKTIINDEIKWVNYLKKINKKRYFKNYL